MSKQGKSNKKFSNPYCSQSGKHDTADNSSDDDEKLHSFDMHKKRSLENTEDSTVLLTPKKKALDIFRAKVQSPTLLAYKRKVGVVLTTVVQDGTMVGLVIEGSYFGRAYLLGSMNSSYLEMLALQSKNKLELLPIKGKYWKKDTVNSVLTSPLSISDAEYMISKTTKEAGTGSILLFTALQLLEADAEADFASTVYAQVKRFFKETKMPPDDLSCVSGFVKNDEQAKLKWREWSPWNVTEEVFELITDVHVDAFLEIAEKSKL